MITALTEGPQSTGCVSCLLRSSTISRGSQPGRMGSAEAFIQTVCLGGFMFGSASSSALFSFSCAGCMRDVWKAPAVFRIFACSAPAFSALSLSRLMAFSVPPQAKPPWKRWLAMRQTAPGPPASSACSQSALSGASSRPATESIFWLPTAAASCMASPRIFTSFRPSSKLKTPATQSAVYSPSERPAMTEARVTASGFSSLSFSMPARPPMNIAGWQYFVSSSLDSGPLRQMSRMS
mmetsp:Transcript_87994/g.273378  ORF Transcript_87994/g.273378 Transcript_87994/m.273378 type:complete len:237 (+) Transcript_87994:45-755(+)